METLTVVNPSEFGLEEKNVKDIEQAFMPKVAERKELEKVYQSVIQKEVSEEVSKEAGELRKKLVKVRTGIANIHKSQKAFFLASGRFVDAWKNKETLPIEQMEETLTKIEKHFEIIEAERLKQLQIERVEQISPYIEFPEERDLASMDDDVWSAYFNTKKLQYEARIKAEKEAELERIKEEKRLEAERQAKIEADRKERERIESENEKLRKEAQERERLAEIERKKRQKEDEARKEKERQAEIERLRIQKELDAKIQAEKEAERKEKERIEAELNKGDEQKIIDLLSDLDSIKSKYDFKSKKNKEILLMVSSRIDSIINDIKRVK